MRGVVRVGEERGFAGFGVGIGVDDGWGSFLMSGLMAVLVEDGRGVSWGGGGGRRRGDLNGLDRVDAADSRRRRLEGGLRGVMSWSCR